MNHLRIIAGNNGSIMPLLMNYTPFTKIEEIEEEIPLIYDDRTQIVNYDMRVIGTRSLKTSSTRKKIVGTKSYTSSTDRKNAIDDSKSVK